MLATSTMSSVGIKPVVSGYQHLDQQIHKRTVLERHSNYSSEDEDLLQLKPKRLTNKTVLFQGMGNMNNSSVFEPTRLTTDATGQSKLFDDMSLSSVPVPFAWSPGMAITSNPSLFITPQKPSINKGLHLPGKENILEPESSNKIPKPVPWSPGMEVQLDPNLFITPEKCLAKKILTGVNGDNGKQGAPSKAREGYSVRFNLPSSTSGEETADSLSETDSPITLKGCEMSSDRQHFESPITSSDRQHFESPIWKTFSPQRTYNPTAYSDDSSLDESITNSLPAAKNNFSYNHLKACVTGSASGQFNAGPSNVFPAATSELLSSHSATLRLNETNQHLAVDGNRGAKDHTSLRLHKPNHSRSTIPVSTKPKAHVDVKTLERSTSRGERSTSRGGRSPTAPESPTREVTVVREMKDNLLSTEYSFPFDLRATTQDSEYEHVFTRPEFNSTLKVRAELNTLYEQEVDVATAVDASLAKSEVKRLELNEKAATYTNRGSSQFKNLIDLNTSVETLCDRIVRMRTSSIVSKKRGTRLDKKLTRPDRAPDLLEFFTSDLQKEVPDLTLPGVTQVTPTLMTAPQYTAFDLYRHNRIWHGINDF